MRHIPIAVIKPAGESRRAFCFHREDELMTDKPKEKPNTPPARQEMPEWLKVKLEELKAARDAGPISENIDLAKRATLM
jgi:hypothetical protein